MPAIDDALERISAEREHDPLAPVTVIVPSRLAALQLRRRLARRGAFAGVRFETPARIAELLAAAALAQEMRRPLARPIADYVATQVALESRAPLQAVADLTGYARALRQTFRRLRRGGFDTGAEVTAAARGGSLDEIARLYAEFRARTAVFYDPEDLLEKAAAILRSAADQLLPELGAVYVVTPCRTSAGAAAFLDALQAVAPRYKELDSEPGTADERFLLAPDPASEARAVARGVIEDLEAGVGLHEIGVFYGGDRAYRALLLQALAAAQIPVANMPGTPLSELPAGRGALALARVALDDYARTALFDFLGPAPLQSFVPTRGGETVAPRESQWQRIAREAGVTHGIERWRRALELFAAEKETELRPESDISDSRRRRAESELDGARSLAGFIEGLVERLEPLRRPQPAAGFIPAFRQLVVDFLDHGAAGYEAVLAEIEQLGTIDAVGGSFDLVSFTTAFEANLGLAAQRTRPLGDGVLLADYRSAAGLTFRRVYICGAYEGAFPAVTTSEPLLQDDVWSRLRRTHPQLEDLQKRLDDARDAAMRLCAAAGAGVLVWSAPLQAANGTREYYPSALMTEAARRRDASIRTASDLRAHAAADWLRRTPSPLASLLSGRVVDSWERRLRQTVSARRRGGLAAGNALLRPVQLLRARRGGAFSEFDGNLAALGDREVIPAGANLSPTALEQFASCGFRFFLGSVLRLRGVEEPEDSPTIGAAERGSLVHRTLERFFKRQQEQGRPRVGERWEAADQQALLAIFDEEFGRLRAMGRAGLEVYADYDRALMRADLVTFLDRDSDFRVATGAVPYAFEQPVAPTPSGDVNLRGFVDRIDKTPDGERAWVIDYKTGSTREFEGLTEADPFLGGAKLQLPVYVLAATGAQEVQALYWFISRRGGFAMLPYIETSAARQRFEATVQSIVEGARAGSFPAVPGDEDEFYGGFKNCRFCDFDRICSRRRLYEHQEKQNDPALAPWKRVGVVARGEDRA